MSAKVRIDGRIVDEAEATVSVLDRGLLFGDGVFETLRTYGGEPFALREHMERLVRSCERIGIALEADAQTLSLEVRETIEAAGEPECYVRVVVTGGRGLGLRRPEGPPTPTRIVMARPLPPPPLTERREGVEVALVRADLPTHAGPARGAKVLSYLGNQLATEEAAARGAYEAVLLDGEGQLVEGASSNVFLVRAGELLTPPASAGLLEGITRKTVVGLARVERLAVRSRALYPRDLYDADEAFVTSSVREIVPVVRADGQPVDDGRPGPLTRRLQALYRAMTGPCRIEGFRG